VLFPQLYRTNAKVKLAETGHGQHSSKFVACVVLFVIRIKAKTFVYVVQGGTKFT
jgi:hypothetical protein